MVLVEPRGVVVYVREYLGAEYLFEYRFRGGYPFNAGLGEGSEQTRDRLVAGGRMDGNFADERIEVLANYRTWL